CRLRQGRRHLRRWARVPGPRLRCRLDALNATRCRWGCRAPGAIAIATARAVAAIAVAPIAEALTKRAARHIANAVQVVMAVVMSAARERAARRAVLERRHIVDSLDHLARPARSFQDSFQE